MSCPICKSDLKASNYTIVLVIQDSGLDSGDSIPIS